MQGLALQSLINHLANSIFIFVTDLTAKGLISLIISLFILIKYLLHFVLILSGEILKVLICSVYLICHVNHV